MSPVRSIALSVATLTTALGLAACSGAGGTGTSSSSAPTTPVTSAAPTTTSVPVASTTASTTASTGASSAASTGSGTSGTPRCAESQLRAGVQADDIRGLDRHVVRLTFLNTSATTCTLTGYPGAAIVDDSGKQVQQAERVVGGPVGGTIEKQSGTITLHAGATAYAYLEGASTRQTGAAQAGCDGPKFPRILVTPPNTSTPVPFTIGWPQCHGFDVHPVRMDT